MSADLLRQAGLLPPVPPPPARQRLDRAEAMAAFVRGGPYEPLATRDEVLEIACRSPGCRADAGQPCSTAFPHGAYMTGMVFRDLSGIHLRRYLDRTHDPR